MWFRSSGERIATIWAAALVIVVFLAMNPLMPGRPSLRWNTGSAIVRPSGGLNLPQDPYWVGSSYYSQFPQATAAGWTNPNRFPISVFFGKPSHSDELAALGINTYLLMEDDGSPVSMITNQGIDLLAQSDLTENVASNIHVPGWFISDECEMGYSGCSDADLNGDFVIDEEDNWIAQQNKYNAAKAISANKFAHANFGNGVLRTFWAPNRMDDHVALMESVGEDKYARTSPDVRDLIDDSPNWPVGATVDSSGTYGWLQDQMELFMAPNDIKPNYVTVETKKPFLGSEPGADSITYDEIDGAVWEAIIHGAAGIMYFQHNDDTVCGNTYSLVECEQGLKDRVTAIDSKIAGLAPVLNSPTLLWNFSAGVDTRLTAYNGYGYVFAGVGLNQTTGSKTFTLPSGVHGGTAEVVGESRNISVSGGQFTDSFAAEYSNHVYKISLA